MGNLTILPPADFFFFYTTTPVRYHDNESKIKRMYLASRTHGLFITSGGQVPFKK
jgi:hypothetical protein